MLSQWVAYFREFWQGHYFLKIVWIVSDETAGNLSLNYYFLNFWSHGRTKCEELG